MSARSSSAYEYALGLLAARAYSVRNLRRKLVQRGYDAAECEGVIGRLVAIGYLDDRKFAEEFARQRLVVGGSSVRRVEQDLSRRGVARDVARAAAELVLEREDVDTVGAMERLALRKLASLGDLDEGAKRRRVFAFLARRGYEIDEINRLVARVLKTGA